MTGFTEEEARQIFARAAERQHAVEARGEGLSLKELQEIGREVGLDPEHVAAAVAELRSGLPVEPVVVAGVDVTPRRVRVLPGELTDEVWEQMVGRLRQTFGAKGIPSEVGRRREWTSGPTSNLHVVAEPVAGGTSVTLETARDSGAAGLWLAPATGGGAVLLFLVLAALQGKLGDPVLWGFVVAFLVFGVVGAVWGRTSLRRWSDTRTGQFEGLLDQFELLMRTTPEPLAEAERPRLDLDALEGPEPPRGAAESRRRTRS